MATVKKLSVFIEMVESQIKKNPRNSLWFRGIGMSKKFKLIPSVYRHKKKTVPELIAVETDMLERFGELSTTYTKGLVQDNWDRLFFMQHHRVPTRLLDWSVNPFVALYFALTEAKNLKSNENPAVCILDPIKWNELSMSHVSFQGEVLKKDSEFLKPYQPTKVLTDIKTMPKNPLAIYGNRNSDRMVVQNGKFVLFGNDDKPMDKYDFSKKCLKKIEFDKKAIVGLIDSLFKIGITPAAVYPDLEGIAKELRHEFGFGA